MPSFPALASSAARRPAHLYAYQTGPAHMATASRKSIAQLIRLMTTASFPTHCPKLWLARVLPRLQSANSNLQGWKVRMRGEKWTRFE